jgi:hypothetical protein
MRGWSHKLSDITLVCAHGFCARTRAQMRWPPYFHDSSLYEQSLVYTLET